MPDLMNPVVIQGGAVGVVAIIVLLILRGGLVPRSYLADLRADRDSRIAEIASERDTWKAAYMTSEDARRLAQGQVGELLELSRTADHLLHSLQRPSEGATRVPVD